MENVKKSQNDNSSKKEWITPEITEISVDGGTTVLLSETFAGNKS